MLSVGWFHSSSQRTDILASIGHSSMMTAPNNVAAPPLHDGGHDGNGNHDGDAHDPASAAIMSYKPPGFSYNIRQIARDSLAVLREGVFGVMDTRTAPRLNAFVQVLSKVTRFLCYTW